MPPLSVAVGLSLFGAYATWAIMFGNTNNVYFADPYLSPFYSPCITASCPEKIRFFGVGWWPFSPAILMMGIILGFRGTCYYYRKAYYRAFFADPPACAVGEFRGDRYKGETSFPWILQNLHRYFMYLSIVVILFLAYDTGHGFFFEDGLGVGVGSIILLINWLLLTGYLFGCHSLRHIIGGNVDCYSCTLGGKARHGLWKRATWFNKRHQLFAWTSLIFVCFTDLYIRLVAMGTFTDLRIL